VLKNRTSSAKIYGIIGVSIVGWILLFPLSIGAEEKGATQITPEFHGLEKICGVWEMDVHNMLNHKEYKYVLQIPPPPDASLTPSKLIVNGHTVYIRWDFPGGFSEDSMLLRRNRKVMEGTFTNFAGARGGISGKLIRPCAKKDE
jgi:hypothetical protein